MAPPDAQLRFALLTEGDPAQRSGGHLYQRRMAEAAGAHGARIDFTSIARRPLVLGMLEARTRLRRVRSADALLLDSIVAAQFAAWLRPRGWPPVIAVVHQPIGGVDHSRIRTATQTALDRLAYRRARALIVSSEYLSDRLTGLGFDRSRITVVRPGRDPAEGTAAVSGGDLRQGRQAAVLCVANWTPNKGIHFLLEAFARLPAGMATLHLVGDEGIDAAYSRRLRARLSAADLRARVVAHGSLDAAAVAGLYASADLFVLPSLREAYGAVCGEAMAAGLPVIAFRTDNLPYLVRDGVDGILAPPGNVTSLAAAMARLCLDRDIRRQAAASARERARGWPTWQQTADDFFRTIRQVLSSS